MEVYAANLANAQGLSPVFVNAQWSYFYNHVVKNLTMPLVVKRDADFQVVSSKANTTAGATNSPIEVTYRNEYGPIYCEIKYTDVRGLTALSSAMKLPVRPTLRALLS